MTASSEPDPVRCDPNNGQTNVSATRRKVRGTRALALNVLHLDTLLSFVRSKVIYWLHDTNASLETR